MIEFVVTATKEISQELQQSETLGDEINVCGKCKGMDTTIKNYEIKIEKLTKQLKLVKIANKNLRESTHKQSFDVSHIKSDKKMNFYTGFP